MAGLLSGAVAAASLGACASGPTDRPAILDAATRTAQIVDGAPFRHVVFRNTFVVATVLHVYIEGDGRPLTWFMTPAKNPTSHTLLMLQLMRSDPMPSLYLGRPCYLGLDADPHCNAHDWTDQRFCAAVVASMRQVLVEEIERARATRVVLIGHSGGATLALLLAREVNAVSAVVTIGGNLDTDGWTRLHGYAPLTGSINPAQLGRLPARVTAIHLVGSKDRVTPPDFVQRSARMVGGSVVVFDGFSHSCCWTKAWPGALALIP